MSRFIVLSPRTTRRLAIAPLALFLAAACGGDDDAPGDADDGGADATPYHPQNPAGLGPAPIDLGTPSDSASASGYVLLAKSGITNVTGSAITGGDLGVSPAAADSVTGFDLTRHASLLYATSDSVVAPGKVFASDYTEPTPTNLTTAVLSMQAAYTDAASRTNPDFLNLGSGEIGGETLAPGLYHWGSDVTIPDQLTLDGGAADVWIFQVTDNFDLSTATAIVLTGGALPANVFWQVAGTVTIHADAHFEGIILGQTGATLQTNATLDGRVLVQTLIALDDNAITAP